MLLGPMGREYIFKSLRIGVHLRIFPFELDPENKSLKLTSSKIRLGLWIFNFFYCLVGAVVFTYRMVRTAGFKMSMLMGFTSSLSFAQVQNLFTILVAVFLLWLCLYLQVVLFLVYKQFPGCFQQIVNYEEYFCRRYASKGKFIEERSRTDFFGYIAAALVYGQYLFGIWVTLMLFLNPSIPIHFFELGGMPTKSYVDFGKYVVNTLLAQYFGLTLMSHTCLWLTFHGLIVIFVITILEEMRHASWKNNVDETTSTQWTKDSLRYPTATARTYRELGILMKIGHDVGYLTLLNSQVTLYILIVLASYMLIRIDNLGFRLASANAVVTNTLLFFTECILFDKVYTTSKDFLSEWLVPDLDDYHVVPRPRVRRFGAVSVAVPSAPSGAVPGAIPGATSDAVPGAASGAISGSTSDAVSGATSDAVTGSDSDSRLNEMESAQENQIKKRDNRRGKIKIDKPTRLWMEKNRKSFKAFQVNLGCFSRFDKELTVNGLMCILDYLIDLLVTC